MPGASRLICWTLPTPRNRERLDEAIAFAEASPLPGPEELLTDVYAGEVSA